MTQDFTDFYSDVHKAGGMSLYRYLDDPRHLSFYLSRYKHTAKILEGKSDVLEVGCGDGFASRIVRQHVGRLTAIDVDARSIQEAQARDPGNWPIRFLVGDILKDVFYNFDAVYCLDVLEHIPPPDTEQLFLEALANAAPVAVIGTPSLESQSYASRFSKEGHVNCKTGEDLRNRLLQFWKHVFLFSMHDETLGTSFAPMAQYRLALCVN